MTDPSRPCPSFPGVQVSQAGQVYLHRGGRLVMTPAHNGAVAIPYPPPARGMRMLSIAALIVDAWGWPEQEPLDPVEDEPGSGSWLADD